MSANRVVTIAVFHEASGWALEERHVERVREVVGSSVEVRRATTSTELADSLEGTTHLVGLPLSEDQVTACAAPSGTVRWVQLSQSIGDATPAMSAAVRSGVTVCTASRVRGPAIAEHALSLVLALTRRLGESISAQGEHRWASVELSKRARVVSSMTVGVVSCGAVGRALVSMMRAVGARVVWAEPSAARPFLGMDGESAPLDGGVALEDMISQCDVMVVACPRIPTTIGVIGKPELTRVKKGALVVELSGGGVVVESALLDALRRDRVAGAALDGFEREPLAVGSPWWTMPNVIVTPRLGGAAHGYWDRSIEWFAENIRRAVRDESPVDVVPEGWVEDAAVARR